MIHIFLFLQIALCCLFSFDLIDFQFYSFKTFAKLNYVFNWSGLVKTLCGLLFPAGLF